MNRSETSLKQQVYTGVMDKIIKGEFAPDSILTEKMIIQEFCVSKSPVREALLELCKDNVLKSIPRCGYQVTQITIKTLHEITKMRLLLEISNFKEIAKLYDKERISAIFDSHESGMQTETIWISILPLHRFQVTNFSRIFSKEHLNCTLALMRKCTQQYLI